MSLAVRNQAAALIAIAFFTPLLFVVFSLPSISLAQDWPQFRGIDGNATAPGATTPTTWSDDENIAWKTKLTGRGSSSPIVVGDRIFLTGYSGYGMSGEAIAKKGGRQRGNRKGNGQKNKQAKNQTKKPDNVAGNKQADAKKQTDANATGGKGPGNKADLKLHMLCFHRSTGKLEWDVSIAASENEQEFTTRVADHGYVSGTPTSDGEHTQLALNKIESDSGLFNASPAISNNQILLRTDSYLYCIGK